MIRTRRLLTTILHGLLLFLSVGLLLCAKAEQNNSYYLVKEGSAIYAQVGEHVQEVGGLSKGVYLQLNSLFSAGNISTNGNSAQRAQFVFGNDQGFIDKAALQALSAKERHKYINVAGKKKPSTNLNLITIRPVQIYSQIAYNSPTLGWLAENLRYPIVAQLVDQRKQKWYEIVIGGLKGYVAASECELDQGIPVLTYHHILRASENKRFRHTSTTTSVTAFTHQMEFLYQQGYQTISAYQLESYLQNKINLPAKAVLLTFDDGLKSVYRYAYPVLKRLGFEAALFVISSRIKYHPQPWDPNTLQFLSVSELKQMEGVFNIQSHTHFLHRVAAHRQPILLLRSYHNILFDFERSRRALSQFNPYIFYLSYPFGGYNTLAISAAKIAGFHMAFTTVQGKVRPGDNPYTLKRLYILSSDSLMLMARRLGHERTVPYAQWAGEM